MEANLTKNLKETQENDISDENIETAGEMFVYLFNKPSNLWKESINFFGNSLESESLRETLLLTSNYDPKDHFEKQVKEILLQVLADHLEFEFLNIDNKTSLQKLISKQLQTGNANFMYTHLFDHNEQTKYNIHLSEKAKLHQVSNHPAHIYDKDGNMSPSAFIPFCQFGDDIQSMGRRTDLLRIPVCNSFKAKMFYDQLCYEVDVKEIFGRKSFNPHELKLGLSLLVDTNFNRQFTLQDRPNTATLTETIRK